jgi:fucose 4-O-acetylase-like acetyltransferase
VIAPSRPLPQLSPPEPAAHSSRQLQEGTPQRRVRDPWFDNAKCLLVTLVVVGHSWTLLPSNWFHGSAYDFLYLWHVPAFVMVTGYLSRRFSWTRRDLRRLLTTVVVPYVVFEGLLALFRATVGGEHLERVWINPHWPMWYLAVLFLWRLATPLLRRLRHPVAVSVAVSLAGGWVGIEAFDLDRAFGLLPFFTLGLIAEQRHIDALRSYGARVLGVAALATAVVVAFWFGGRIGNEWFYYRTAYAELGADWLMGPVLRLAFLAAGTALALAFLSLVPTRRLWLTGLGAASLVVYLGHGFFVLAAEYAGFEQWAGQHPVVSWPLATAAAVVVAVGLAWRPVAKRLDKVVTPVA